MDPEDATGEKDHAPQNLGSGLRKVAGKTLVTMVVLLALAVTAGYFAKEELDFLCDQVAGTLGAPGLFGLIFVFEALPVPGPYLSLVYLLLKGKMDKFVLFPVCCAGSYAGLLAGYTAGRCISGSTFAARLFNKLMPKYPQAAQLVRERGALGVAAGCLLPVPVALVSWPAGSLRVPITHVLLGGCARLVKVLVVVLLSLAAIHSEEHGIAALQSIGSVSRQRASELNGAAGVRQALALRGTAPDTADVLLVGLAGAVPAAAPPAKELPPLADEQLEAPSLAASPDESPPPVKPAPAVPPAAPDPP